MGHCDGFAGPARPDNPRRWAGDTIAGADDRSVELPSVRIAQETRLRPSAGKGRALSAQTRPAERQSRGREDSMANIVLTTIR